MLSIPHDPPTSSLRWNSNIAVIMRQHLLHICRPCSLNELLQALLRHSSNWNPLTFHRSRWHVFRSMYVRFYGYTEINLVNKIGWEVHKRKCMWYILRYRRDLRKPWKAQSAQLLWAGIRTQELKYDTGVATTAWQNLVQPKPTMVSFKNNFLRIHHLFNLPY